MKYFSDKAMSRYLKPSGETDWQRLWSDYQTRLDSLCHLLSPAWKQFVGFDLHDQQILSVSRPSKKQCIIVLTDFTLKFSDVRFLWLPERCVGGFWLYSEIEPAEQGGITLEVRLSCDEIKITAENVETLRTKRD